MLQKRLIMKNELKDIEEKIKKCSKCRLYLNRKNAVPGEGPYNAKIMFIGEAPGNQEDNTGLPFVGRSGKLLDYLLEISDLDRKKVFITSVIKCHPPNNRKPKSDELNKCINLWIYKQIELINPDLIVILGGIALKSMLNENQIKRLHGEIITRADRKFFITYHPAAGLRNPNFKDKLENDFKKLRKLIY